MGINLAKMSFIIFKFQVRRLENTGICQSNFLLLKLLIQLEDEKRAHEPHL